MREDAKALTFLLAAALVLAGGCATLAHGTKQALPVESDPPGAVVSWDRQSAETPGQLVVPRRADGVTLRFAKPGYRPCTVSLRSSVSGVYWANLALIPVGLVAGAAVGAAADGGSYLHVEGGVVGAFLGTALIPAVGMAIDSGNGAARGYPVRSVAVTLAPLAEGGGPVADEPAPCEPRPPAGNRLASRKEDPRSAATRPGTVR